MKKFSAEELFSKLNNPSQLDKDKLICVDLLASMGFTREAGERIFTESVLTHQCFVQASLKDLAGRFDDLFEKAAAICLFIGSLHQWTTSVNPRAVEAMLEIKTIFASEGKGDL